MAGAVQFRGLLQILASAAGQSPDSAGGQAVGTKQSKRDWSRAGSQALGRAPHPTPGCTPAMSIFKNVLRIIMVFSPQRQTGAS